MRPQSQPRKTLFSPLFLAALFGLSSISTAATVIYQHNFGGSPSDSLDGAALDTTNPTLGGTAGATWTSDPIFRADGSRLVPTPFSTTTYQHSAFVPFSPVSGYIYTISLTINNTTAPRTTSIRWIALSLTDGIPTTDSSFATTTGGTDYAAVARRNHGADSPIHVLRRTGPNASSTVSDITGSPTGEVSILLDTTNADQWTFRWIVSGVTSESYNFDATGNIDYIRISSDGYAFGDISGFSVTAIPEPGVTLLSSLGACLITLRRTRRKTPCGSR